VTGARPGAGQQTVEQVLDRLHRAMDRAYGDAWCRRGMVLGIVANVARKHDRLEVALAEDEPSAGESLADTLADLTVYAGRYLTWLALHEPDALPPGPPADRSRVLDVAGSRRLRRDPWRPARPAADVQGWAASEAAARGAFSDLDAAFVRQADGGTGLPTGERVRSAWAWTGGALGMLRALASRTGTRCAL